MRDPQTGLHRAMYLADGTAVPQVAPEQPTSPLKMAVFRDIGRHSWHGCWDFGRKIGGCFHGTYIFLEAFMGIYSIIRVLEVYIYML